MTRRRETHEMPVLTALPLTREEAETIVYALMKLINPALPLKTHDLQGTRRLLAQVASYAMELRNSEP